MFEDEEQSDEEQREETGIQWTTMGGAYTGCGTTQPKIPAGFYRVEDLGYGRMGLAPRKPASDHLIDIPGTVADEIFTDIDTFMAVKDKFRSFELTHKRGYLFYGPPGSGKTSIAMMLARRFIEKSDGVVVYIDEAEYLSAAVELMRAIEPGRPSMYLIEEADTIVDDTSCLSILDGELSIQGAVFVAMTNYKDKLPPCISNRPGRFDQVVLVDCPPAGVQVEYLRRVAARNPGLSSAGPAPEKIVKALEGLPISMAHLREAFIASVLMGVSLTKVRKRFDEMNPKEEDEDDDGTAALQKVHAALRRQASKRRK